MRILIIDDDRALRYGLRSLLEGYGTVDEAETFDDGRNQLTALHYDIAFIDLNLDIKKSGFDLITVARQQQTYAVMLTGEDDDETTRTAYELGCNDFLLKSGDQQAITETFERYKKAAAYTEQEKTIDDFCATTFVTQDKETIAAIKFVLLHDVGSHPIFLSGPSGVGKTVLARAIHNQTLGPDRPFIKLNCSNTAMIESELFGYVAGAFTGAKKAKKGMLALADGGTLFMDEIGHMPPKVQDRLLTSIEEKEFYPIGSEKLVKSNFRVISATLVDMREKINAKEFRHDLFLRLDDIKLTLKPLIARKADIFLQIDNFLHNRRRIVFTDAAKKCLLHYDWPGNSRELKQVIERLLLRTEGIIEEHHIQPLLNDTPDNEPFLDDNHFNYIREHGMKSFNERINQEAVSHFYNTEKNKGAAMRAMDVGTRFFYKYCDRSEP